MQKPTGTTVYCLMPNETRNALLLAFAWVVSIAAMAGSLYFSQVRHFMPCELCWYQRILMYPMVVLLGIATYRGDIGIRIYALPLTLLGVLIASMNYMEQKIPGFQPMACGATPIPCSGQYLQGWLTIPLMSLVAFVLISLALIMIRAPKHT